ncbi:MAG: hypothetical protein A4E50_02236 [Methanosaeta sp. PtaB.Bin087]|jgi:hypothetical protein|nr:MAG: hypothetical protein A4E50_02236 [Methanosaeta sp. PtaB.Bin087]
MIDPLASPSADEAGMNKTDASNNMSNIYFGSRFMSLLACERIVIEKTHFDAVILIPKFA